jgi:hypothetical protein
MSSTHQHNVVDSEMVTCDNCGNSWDGYAQCWCDGIPMDDYVQEMMNKVTTHKPSPPTHTMTLRSHISDEETPKISDEIRMADTEQVSQPRTHPDFWNELTHYGQCGQSCPCCRSEVGDELGSCLVCSKKY